MLSPSSLRGLRAALHRILTSPPYSRQINILIDKVFLQTNKMFEAMCKNYVQGQNPRQKHHPSIEKGDLQKIAAYIKHFKSSPENLLHSVWFLLSYNFARRGREGWREMNRNTFTVKVDDEGQEYLSMDHTESNKNWQGGSSSKAWDYSDVRAYGFSLENENINIVEVYRYYVGKLHPECSALFQKPKYKKWGLSEGSIWFDNIPFGVNKIGEIMKRISECAALSKVYTNHSIRATAITIMYQGGVDTKQICKVTKHKSEESLKHYIDGQSSAQKRQCSKVLSSAFSTGQPSASTSAPSAPTSAITLVHSQTQSNTGNATTANHFVPTSNTQIFSCTRKNFSFPAMHPQSFNFNVSGGTCHFHFHYDSPQPSASTDSNLQ